MTVIGVMLAGGRSRRMGGPDKAEIKVGGRRLIDHVSDRLQLQVDELIISGPKDYGLGLEAIPDADDVVGGPAGGVMSAALWFARRRPEITAFLTVPVDGPSFPTDFASRMAGAATAVAVDDCGLHPTFAWWQVAGVAAAHKAYSPSDKLSLRALADAVSAEPVAWKGAAYFINLNTPEDVAAWEAGSLKVLS